MHRVEGLGGDISGDVLVGTRAWKEQPFFGRFVFGVRVLLEGLACVVSSVKLAATGLTSLALACQGPIASM